MTVRVKLFGPLKQHLPAGTQDRQTAMEVPTGARVCDVARLVGMSDDAARIVLVNGEHVEADVEVREGDTVSIFPPI